MTLTTKETGLLKDLKTQEQLCIEKYTQNAQRACSNELKDLFNSLAQVEREHLKTVNEMMGGKVPSVPSQISGNNCNCACANYTDEDKKKNDAFLCQDMLTAEKHASSLYDTCVFEFTDPQARKMLNHIQAEEQQHGEKIYTYMSNNNMMTN